MADSNKRIQRDFIKLRMADFKVDMANDDMKEFDVFFHGPKKSFYQGGVWRVRVRIKDDYPYTPPVIGFVTPIYHPNINSTTGIVCLDALNEAWKPVYDLVHVFEIFLPQLLLHPNPDDPYNSEAAVLMINDRETYDIKVSEYCKMYAMPEAEEESSGSEEITEDEHNDDSE